MYRSSLGTRGETRRAAAEAETAFIGRVRPWIRKTSEPCPLAPHVLVPRWVRAPDPPQTSTPKASPLISPRTNADVLALAAQPDVQSSSVPVPSDTAPPTSDLALQAAPAASLCDNPGEASTSQQAPNATDPSPDQTLILNDMNLAACQQETTPMDISRPTSDNELAALHIVVQSGEHVVQSNAVNEMMMEDQTRAMEITPTANPMSLPSNLPIPAEEQAKDMVEEQAVGDPCTTEPNQSSSCSLVIVENIESEFPSSQDKQASNSVDNKSASHSTRVDDSPDATEKIFANVGFDSVRVMNNEAVLTASDLANVEHPTSPRHERIEMPTDMDVSAACDGDESPDRKDDAFTHDSLNGVPVDGENAQMGLSKDAILGEAVQSTADSVPVGLADYREDGFSVIEKDNRSVATVLNEEEGGQDAAFQDSTPELTGKLCKQLAADNSRRTFQSKDGVLLPVQSSLTPVDVALVSVAEADRSSAKDPDSDLQVGVIQVSSGTTDASPSVRPFSGPADCSPRPSEEGFLFDRGTKSMAQIVPMERKEELSDDSLRSKDTNVVGLQTTLEAPLSTLTPVGVAVPVTIADDVEPELRETNSSGIGQGIDRIVSEGSAPIVPEPRQAVISEGGNLLASPRPSSTYNAGSEVVPRNHEDLGIVQEQGVDDGVDSALKRPPGNPVIGDKQTTPATEGHLGGFAASELKFPASSAMEARDIDDVGVDERSPSCIGNESSALVSTIAPVVCPSSDVGGTLDVSHEADLKPCSERKG